jgi:hypothetical protein
MPVTPDHLLQSVHAYTIQIEREIAALRADLLTLEEALTPLRRDPPETQSGFLNASLGELEASLPSGEAEHPQDQIYAARDALAKDATALDRSATALLALQAQPTYGG